MSTDFRSPAAVTAALVAMLAAPAAAMAADYVQASGSSLAFASRYDGETFTGTFPGFSTRLSFDPARPADGRLEVTIPLAGADTGNAERDETLKDAAFFDVARFAQARYTASGFRALGGDRYAADGTLSLRGVSRPVTLEFSWTPGPRPLLSGRASVPRLAFGIGTGDWADTATLPDAVAVSTRVYLSPAR